MFSDPEALAILAALAVATVVVTWVFDRVVGRRIARRSRTLAMTVTAAVAPACMLIYGVAIFQIDSRLHPGNDMPPMALAGSIMIAMMMLVLTVPMSVMLVSRNTAGRG